MATLSRREPVAHRRARGEGQHRAGPEAAVEQLEEGPGGVEQGVVLAQRAVGDPDRDGGEPVMRVAGERRVDEGSEAGDVGCEHGDVTGLEAGKAVGVAFLEQVEHGVA